MKTQEQPVQTVIRAGINHMAVLSNILTRAFMNDPLQRFTFSDEIECREKSPVLFEALLRYGVLFGEVYTTPAFEGAIVLLKPGETDVTLKRAEDTEFDQLPILLGKDQAKRFFSVLSFLEPYHQEITPLHWYVMVMGVDPSFQGKGIGQALLQLVLTRAKENKIPIYLETAEPSNVLFYQKIGFRILRELIEPKSKLRLWTFILDHK